MFDPPAGRDHHDDGAGIARLAERDALGRLELLATVSRSLSRVLDDEGPALAEVVEACVPDFCDLLAIEAPDEGGEVATVAYRSIAASGLSLPATWIPAGRSVASDGRATLGWDGASERPDLRDLRVRLGADSVVVAPMPVGGVLVGWLVMANGPRRRGLRPSALALAEELAARIGTAIQRKLLYHQAKEAAREQAQVVRRLRRLASAAGTLSGVSSPVEVLRVACIEACLLLEADSAAVGWRHPDGRLLRADAGLDGRLLAERVDEGLRSGRPAHGPGWVSAPLPCSDRRDAGVIVLGLDRTLHPDEEVMLGSVAALVPVAFERAVNSEQAVLHEARLRTVLDSSPIAIFAVDGAGEAVRWNDAAAQLFGWPADDDDISASVPEQIRPAIAAVAAEVRTGVQVSGWPAVSDDFDLSVSGWWRPGLTTGEEGTVAVAVIDLGARRRAERSLLQAQRMEAMGQVAGRVAHDFNNLLTLIVGWTAIIGESVQGDQERRLLGKIDEAAGRAAGLTRQMLGLTRRQVDTGAVVDLGAVLGGLGDVLSRIAGPRVSATCSVPDRPVPVGVESGDLEQVVVNLAINACDAMERVGRLEIVLDVEHLDDWARPDLGLPSGVYARLEVRDDGPGMSEDVLDRCMEPFFTTKTQRRGSGLGLSTVHGLVVERGGAVAIESAPGSGTVVSVRLPVVADDRIGRDPGADDGRPLPRLRGRALLVEDEADLRELAASALTDTGLEVLALASAEDALAALETWGPCDVLVTDIVLPGLSGMDLAERLRTSSPELPVVYTSGYAGAPGERSMVEGSRTLRKPYRPAELCRTVAGVLRPQGS